ncbi:uncharacterized protein LOC113536986 isoform X2 [Pangasianodon hypophthalmus]|uniref:uncharacterized protein LOC113536986 isoform X2 n=1 Tax=Pangasianodon hypophthalmus TaxID=310915 RepID=UPI0023081A31|nr:uncharacterized protein LOC113536986 isoform X2 [Pangasianodon hypophthalmus]XP_053094538.1 uncharacterized protein LOC113536986 isoform X2 [Pangasianodon hypophthalmus]
MSPFEGKGLRKTTLPSLPPSVRVQYMDLEGYHKVIESMFLFTLGFHLHGPSDPLIAQLGGSVMLPCFVERPLPIEELEVEWKRNDSETLVHLWLEGESRPESQNQRYRERAHFFTEEIAHGNFSLFLTNVTREDVGVYKCAVYTNLDSDETLIEIKEIERLIVSGGHVISAYAGEDVTLNCSVDSNIPPENIEEVSWKKMDEDILVLLYQENEVLTDSSHERYRDRVEFFSAEERNKGNFSLRLKSVQTEDKGLYICLAFSGALSDNTTVEVQQLGFSSMHIGIFVLCILGFVIGSLILGYLSFTSFKNEDDSRRALAIHCAHVLSPNITMFIVFILWGVTEGIFTEAATCSALNFVRIFFLLWITLHLTTFQDYLHQLINRLAILLQFAVITLVAYLPVVVDVWYKTNTVGKALIAGGLLLGLILTLLYVIAVVCCRRNLQTYRITELQITEIDNFLRIFAIVMIYGLHPKNITVAVFPLLALIWFFCHAVRERLFLLWISVMMILEVVGASGSIYFHYDFVNNVKERDGLTCVTAFLNTLTVMILFTSLTHLSVTKSDSRNTGTQRSLSHLVVFVFGTAVVVFVNAVALLVELILKSRNGQRTVDLRVILLPTESVFAVCCLALQLFAFWQENRERFREDINRLRGLCGCKQTPMNSPPENHEHDLENLAPASQPSGS